MSLSWAQCWERDRDKGRETEREREKERERERDPILTHTLLILDYRQSVNYLGLRRLSIYSDPVSTHSGLQTVS